MKKVTNKHLVSKIEEGDILEEKVVVDKADSKIENNSDETNKTDVKETKKIYDPKSGKEIPYEQRPKK